MALILPTLQSARWVIPSVGADGVTELGAATGTRNTLDTDLIWAEGDAEFLDACNGEIGDYNPIPSTGEWCEAGTLYGYNGGAVICRQSHFRMAYTPEETPALWLFYNPSQPGRIADWIVSEQVHAGDLRNYATATYQCLQSHVTQVDWYPTAPGILGVLWVEYNPEPPDPDWAYPVSYTGDNTAGAGNGDVVIYQAHSYRCLQTHTSNVAWTPVATINVLWVLLT